MAIPLYNKEDSSLNMEVLARLPEEQREPHLNRENVRVNVKNLYSDRALAERSPDSIQAMGKLFSEDFDTNVDVQAQVNQLGPEGVAILRDRFKKLPPDQQKLFRRKVEDSVSKFSKLIDQERYADVYSSHGDFEQIGSWSWEDKKQMSAYLGTQERIQLEKNVPLYKVNPFPTEMTEDFLHRFEGASPIQQVRLIEQSKEVLGGKHFQFIRTVGRNAKDPLLVGILFNASHSPDETTEPFLEMARSPREVHPSVADYINQSLNNNQEFQRYLQFVDHTLSYAGESHIDQDRKELLVDNLRQAIYNYTTKTLEPALASNPRGKSGKAETAGEALTELFSTDAVERHVQNIVQARVSNQVLMVDAKHGVFAIDPATVSVEALGIMDKILGRAPSGRRTFEAGLFGKRKRFEKGVSSILNQMVTIPNPKIGQEIAQWRRSQKGIVNLTSIGAMHIPGSILWKENIVTSPVENIQETYHATRGFFTRAGDFEGIPNLLWKTGNRWEGLFKKEEVSIEEFSINNMKVARKHGFYLSEVPDLGGYIILLGRSGSTTYFGGESLKESVTNIGQRPSALVDEKGRPVVISPEEMGRYVTEAAESLRGFFGQKDFTNITNDEDPIDFIVSP